MLLKKLFFTFLICFLFLENQAFTPSQEYDSLQRKLATGWNTWNTRSVLSHVLLPEGLAVNWPELRFERKLVRDHTQTWYLAADF